MKKHAIILLCIISILFCSLSVCACDENGVAAELNPTKNASDSSSDISITVTEPEETSAEAFSFEETDGAITVTGLTENDTPDVVIPRTINGLPVTAVSDYAFANRKDIKSVYVTANVTKMGYGALSGCSALTSVTLPFTGAEHKTEKGLKDYNFGYVFGETPYSGGKSVMQFYHKDSMESVEMVYYYIPDSLKEVKITGAKETHIPYAAFYNCDTLETITLGREITDIGAFAFSGVTGKIEWENPKIETIGEHAFEDFKGEEINIPESVTEIKRSAYSSCVNVKSFTVPDGVKKMDIYAFAYGYELESVTLGKNVEILPVETFYFCTNLKTVNLADGLTQIEDGAFDSCKALAEIEIPSSVTRINANAFKNCGKLKTVIFLDASDWRYYGTMTSGDYFSPAVLSNPTTAAKYLTDNFRDYIWEKTPR